jgi:serine/threonine protein kinase
LPARPRCRPRSTIPTRAGPWPAADRKEPRMSQTPQGKAKAEPSPKQTAFLKVLAISEPRFQTRLTTTDYQLFETATLDPAAFKKYREGLTKDVPKELLAEVDKKFKEAKDAAIADKPKIRDAVRKLVEADTACRQIANGHFQSITFANASLRIERLEGVSSYLVEKIGQVEREMARTLQSIDEFPRFASIKSPGELRKNAELLVQWEEYWRSKLASVKGGVKLLGSVVEQAALPAALAAVRTDLRILDERLHQDVSALAARADQVETALRRGTRELVKREGLEQWQQRKELEFETAIRLITSKQVREEAASPQEVQSSRVRVVLGAARVRGAAAQARQGVDQVIGQLEQLSTMAADKPLLMERAVQIKQRELLDKLRALGEASKADYAAAAQRMKSASGTDALNLGIPLDDALGLAPQAPVFKVDDAIHGIDLPAKLGTLDPLLLPAKAQQAGDKLLAHMRALAQTDPDSDVLFDLAIKTTADLEAMLATRLGVDLQKASPQEQAVVRKFAETLSATIDAASTNRQAGAAVKLSTKDGAAFDAPGGFNLGAAQFGSPKYLASGAFGHAVRYTQAGTAPDQPPQHVVLKTPVSADGFADMASELKMHRHVQGNSGGQGHPNVLGQKGVVRGPDGTFFSVSEFAGGGGMDEVGYAIGGAAATGILNEEARQVIAQHLFLQTVAGMAQLHDRSMVHRDIKPENVFMAEDGTVKVADFGSARILDATGRATALTPDGDGGMKKDIGGVDQKFAAPEHEDEDVDHITSKSDTFPLGVLLSRLASPLQGQAQMYSGFTSEWSIKQQPEKASTALDRLRRAMLDPDPEKRPDLQAVQFSAYLDDEQSAQHPPERVQALVAATMQYSRHVGSLLGKDQELLLRAQGEIADLQQQKSKQLPAQMKSSDDRIATLTKEVAAIRKRIDAVLNDAKCKPYVDALAQASEALGGRGALPRRDDGSAAPEVGASTTDVDPASVDLLKEFAAAFEDAGVDPLAIGQRDPGFARKYKYLLSVLGMLKPGAGGARRATIHEQVGVLVADLLKKVRGMLVPDESLSPQQAKAQRDDATLRGLSKLTSSLGSFAGTVSAVAKPRPGPAPDLAQARLLDQYIASFEGLGVPRDRINQRLLGFLSTADAAKDPAARATALLSAAGQIERDLSILEGLRSRVQGFDSAEHAKQKTAEQYREKAQTAKRCKDALGVLQQLFKDLDSPDEGIDFLGPLSEIVRTTQVTLDDELIRLLMKADDEDPAVRVATRREARTLVSKEGNRLIAWVKELAAEAGELRKPESIAQMKKDIDRALVDRKLDVSKVGTEMRKWKAQLEQAAAHS